MKNTVRRPIELKHQDFEYILQVCSIFVFNPAVAVTDTNNFNVYLP